MTDVPRPSTALADRSATDPLPYSGLLTFTTRVFVARGVPCERARRAAEALCYGDLTGTDSHGLVNLTRLYLPLLDAGRADPRAAPVVLADRGAAVRVDARRALGLWHASDAMDLAADRAAEYGVGLVSVRGGTHVGCAGYHALRAVRRGMVGLVASNCGGQRIARPPGGAVAMLGTNPLAVAAPTGTRHPYVLDMSTTVVPTGRVRAAARAGRAIPAGWLADDRGAPVTDPTAYDRGEAHLLWLGGTPETGSYKGFGLGLAVEVLAALVSGSGTGPAPEALTGDGRPTGRDDDIGYTAVAIAPGTLRDPATIADDARRMFGALLDCPPTGTDPVRHPGWYEAERAATRQRAGVPLAGPLAAELRALSAATGVPFPLPVAGAR
ncbi:Ldh family oxidoreductase [Actinocatenispora rupis]|uniref:Malate dehydrogenase n=1 Tax=Actinocatenispora rupis TaxID=519421 RepID=A0A8J3J3M3_9ACTN|nr:Ldh family oxidoreductase [Actinocatenispora rupis]GID11011.1 malate dehydrogenase [Actinocatenispora rupis]